MLVGVDGQSFEHQVWHAANAAPNSPVCERIFLPVSSFSADSLIEFLLPQCANTCVKICAHAQNPQHCQPYTIVWTPKLWPTLLS